MAGIDTKDPRVQKDVLPTLYSRLPAEVQAGMSNITTIDQLLKHVDRFDRPPVNLSEILNNSMLHNALPSTTLNVIEEELRVAFPHGMTKGALRRWLGPLLVRECNLPSARTSNSRTFVSFPHNINWISWTNSTYRVSVTSLLRRIPNASPP
jgi:hypothetical protein